MILRDVKSMVSRYISVTICKLSGPHISLNRGSKCHFFFLTFQEGLCHSKTGVGWNKHRTVFHMNISENMVRGVQGGQKREKRRKTLKIASRRFFVADSDFRNSMLVRGICQLNQLAPITGFQEEKQAASLYGTF